MVNERADGDDRAELQGRIKQYLGLASALGFVAVWFVFWGFWQWLIFAKWRTQNEQ